MRSIWMKNVFFEETKWSDINHWYAIGVPHSLFNRSTGMYSVTIQCIVTFSWGIGKKVIRKFDSAHCCRTCEGR